MRSWGDWLIESLFYFFLFTFFAFFVYNMHINYFFFFRIVRIYVLSLLFLVYSVHINHFFLSYYKNLWFYILSLFFLFFFFLLFTACTSIIFFSSISYCKNLCTFFRIKINVLIVLESIIICFVWYFYHKRTWHIDKPNCFGQKNTKRIRICILFLYLSPLFWQCHCHKPITKIFPPISAMALPQTNCNNFFSLLFRQCHCHKSITQFFFFEK